MSGALSAVKPNQVLHFDLKSEQLHQQAKARGVSVTAYMLALMFMACRAATDAAEGNIQIQVPVNMRKFYPSQSIRNFSLYCSINLPIAQITTVEEILPEISRQLKEKAAPEPMYRMLNGAVKMVKSLKYVPLFIKAPVAGAVYGFLGDRVFTNTLSNLGVVEIPEAMRPYLQKLDFVLGLSATNRAACSMVTVGDTATFSITKGTADPSFEEKIYALLKEDGLEPRVSGSCVYGN